MASPQTENGYIKIATELWDALVKLHLPGAQRQVLDAIIRKTYGFHKKKDFITLKQFVEMTGIRKQHIVRAISVLLSRNVIFVTKNGNRSAHVYEFNKNYTRWGSLPKMVMLPKLVTSVTKNGNKKTVTPMLYKDTITKDNIPIVPLPDFIDQELWDQFMIMRKKKKATPTEFAVKLLIKKLNGFHASGFDVNKIIELSIENNWKGLFEPKNNKKGADNDKYTNF